MTRGASDTLRSMATSSIHIQPDPEKLLSRFIELVHIDSPSGDEGALCAHLQKLLAGWDIQSEVDIAGNLIFRIPASPDSRPFRLIMTGHMDVVPPCQTVQPIISGSGLDRIIQSAGNTVLGGDDKSALAIMLEAMLLTLKHGLPHPELLFLITTREEVMLQGAKEMESSVYADADFAIALDHTGPQGTIIYEAPTYVKFTITVHGKSVHAGIMPEKGINAIHLLSRVLEKIRFGRLDENTTSNLGMITGGKATNIVPDQVTVEGEIRAHDPGRLQMEIDRFEEVLHQVIDPVDGASFELKTEAGFHHYRTSPEHPEVQRIVAAMKALEIPVNLIRTNGGSDVNVFAYDGIPGIVLAAAYENPHSLNETVSLREMVTGTRLLLSIWEHMAAS